MATIEKGVIYEAPGASGSPVELKERYDNFIGGAGSPPDEGRVPRQPHAGHRRAVLPRCRTRPPRTSSSRSTPPTPPRTRGAETSDHGALARPQRDRRRHRGEPRDALDRRELGQRQAGARDARRRPPARDRPLPLLRERHPRRGGVDLRDRQGHGRLPLPRAARRRRPDHPVQLPAADGGVEDRPGARRRQLHGRQAGQPDAVVDPQAGRGHRATSSRPACSTSSTVPARRSARRSPRTSASPRSPSPARR